jgi:hypothetical protein
MATVAKRRGSASTSSYSSSQGDPTAQPPPKMQTAEAKEGDLLKRDTNASEREGSSTLVPGPDAFGNEDGAEIQYKTCKW